eukprot:gene3196-4347_t
MAKNAVPASDGLVFVAKHDIITLNAEGSYTTLVLVGGKKILSTRHLKEYEESLPPGYFIRVHHSHIINLEHVIHYQRGEGGAVSMTDGSVTVLPRSKPPTYCQKPPTYCFFRPLVKPSSRKQYFLLKFAQVKAALFFVALTSSAYFASAQYTVEWTNLVNVSTSSGGTTITKTAGFGYDGRAVSINELPTCVNGTIEFTASNVSTQSRYIGFTTNGGSNSSDILHGFLINYGSFYFINNGTLFPGSSPFTVSNGDRFKIERV